jgi:hypothetical protein
LRISSSPALSSVGLCAKTYGALIEQEICNFLLEF